VILVGGEALVDLVPGVDGGFLVRPGGGPYNAARTIGRLDVPVGFLGSLSTDQLGGRLRAGLADAGVELSLAVSTTRPTTLALASIDAGGAASYSFYLEGTSAARLATTDLPAQLPSDVEAIYTGTLSLLLEPVGTTLSLLAEREVGRRLVVVDPNIRADATGDPDGLRSRVQRLIHAGAVIKANDADMAWLFPGVELGAAMARVVDQGSPLVVVTLAASGAVGLRRHGQPVRVAAPPVAVVDTIGAGDAFGGGLMAWWHDHGQLGRAAGRDGTALTDEELAAALRFAGEVAGRTCARVGADPPWRHELAG